MILFQRHQWGAVGGSGAALAAPRTGIVIHHTASPAVYCGATLDAEARAVRGIERHHVESNGWAGIGYHWLVMQSGHVYEGRGWDRVGAHAKGHNRSAYGIALVIDGGESTPTHAAREAVQELIQEALDTGRLTPAYDLVGHRDVWGTECPGDVLYRVLEDFRV